jgi:hypothetical protein
MLAVKLVRVRDENLIYEWRVSLIIYIPRCIHIYRIRNNDGPGSHPEVAEKMVP